MAPLNPLVNPGFQNTGVEIDLQFEQVTFVERLIINALAKEALVWQLGQENFGMLKIRTLQALQKNRNKK